MKRLIFLSATLCFAAVLTTDNAQPIKAAVRSTPGDATLADYFRNETALLSERSLADIPSREDWESKRAEYRRPSPASLLSGRGMRGEKKINNLLANKKNPSTININQHYQ